MSELGPTLAALADPTRRAVIERLRDGPLRAGELASSFGMSPPAMSRHLRVLRERGLVEEARADPTDARVRLYRLRPDGFDELWEWLAEVRATWTEQLDALREHVESGR